MRTGDQTLGSVSAITQDFLRRIHAGEFRGGVRLPSYAALAGEYETTQSVVQNVYGTLHSMGVVASIRGRAMYLQDTYSVWAHPDSEHSIVSPEPTVGELQLARRAMESGTSSLAGQVVFALRSISSEAKWSDWWETPGAVHMEWCDGPSVTDVIAQLLPSREVGSGDLEQDGQIATSIAGIPTLRLLTQTGQGACLHLTSPQGTRLYLNRLAQRHSTRS